MTVQYDSYTRFNGDTIYIAEQAISTFSPNHNPNVQANSIVSLNNGTEVYVMQQTPL
jgi:hypothetical protein